MVETPTRQTGATRAMSTAERDEARRLQQQGMGVREIARRFGRAPSTISRILREGRGTTRRGGAARAGARRQPARTTRGRTTAQTGTISRQELRTLEQRISKIESSLSRMANMFKPAGTRARSMARKR